MTITYNDVYIIYLRLVDKDLISCLLALPCKILLTKRTRPF